jgi:hypothetical protein
MQHQAALDILFGYANERTQQLGASQGKLAHYTTADNALKIIDGQSLWLRNATVMNDHSEIEHGLGIVNAALEMPAGQRLRAVLSRADPRIADGVFARAAAFAGQKKTNFFMTSLSEHAEGDVLGRLSMWRAYGGPSPASPWFSTPKSLRMWTSISAPSRAQCCTATLVTSSPS